jgi:uncharacterized membrane protein YhaH (DUF805 family)
VAYTPESVDRLSRRYWWAVLICGVVGFLVPVGLGVMLASSREARVGFLVISAPVGTFSLFLIFMAGVRYAERAQERPEGSLWSPSSWQK